jgi:predicted Fe-Mo cluster-binding NifX family protein
VSYKIAVASSDGKVVNQHFGHCRSFIIFEVKDSGSWQFSENRITAQACSSGEHDEGSMQSVAKLLSDCTAVVASQIGFGAVQELKTFGIKAYAIPDYIDMAMRKLVTLNLSKRC